MRTKIKIAAVLLLAGVGVLSYLFLVNPRMYIQPHIRAFQARFPEMPEGTVPVASPIPPVPTSETAEKMPLALPPTSQNLAVAQVYYGRYCVFCHGDNGRGDGPVGESYLPEPADLTGPTIQGYSDAQLLRAMLTGCGHTPVLERVKKAWPYLILQVRQLGRDATSQPTTQPPPRPKVQCPPLP